MKSKCPACMKTLYVADEQAARLKRPLLKCPNCQTHIRLLPTHAKCGNCNAGFKYYKYKFTNGNQFVRCPSCTSINRIAL